MDDVVEVPQFRTEHEVEEAAERSEDDDELHHEGWETNEAKFDCGRDLFEGFLETEINKIESLEFCSVRLVAWEVYRVWA